MAAPEDDPTPTDPTAGPIQAQSRREAGSSSERKEPWTHDSAGLERPSGVRVTETSPVMGYEICGRPVGASGTFCSIGHK